MFSDTLETQENLERAPIDKYPTTRVLSSERAAPMNEDPSRALVVEVAEGVAECIWDEFLEDYTEERWNVFHESIFDLLKNHNHVLGYGTFESRKNLERALLGVYQQGRLRSSQCTAADTDNENQIRALVAKYAECIADELLNNNRDEQRDDINRPSFARREPLHVQRDNLADEICEDIKVKILTAKDFDHSGDDSFNYQGWLQPEATDATTMNLSEDANMPEPVDEASGTGGVPEFISWMVTRYVRNTFSQVMDLARWMLSGYENTKTWAEHEPLVDGAEDDGSAISGSAAGPLSLDPSKATDAATVNLGEDANMPEQVDETSGAVGVPEFVVLRLSRAGCYNPYCPVVTCDFFGYWDHTTIVDSNVADMPWPIGGVSLTDDGSP